jgi:hypothetical protein
MERSTHFSYGNIHYFYVVCSIVMLNYQRVSHVFDGKHLMDILVSWKVVDG